jgi:predicted RNase H-like HicB family nuclease
VRNQAMNFNHESPNETPLLSFSGLKHAAAPSDNTDVVKIIVKEDGDGYLARVRGSQNLYAYGLTEEQALEELSGVIDMTMDYHLEQVDIERRARQELLTKRAAYAV